MSDPHWARVGAGPMRSQTCRWAQPPFSGVRPTDGAAPVSAGQRTARDRCRGAEGCGGLVSGLLVDLLEDGLGGALHEVLGLLEAEAGQRADLLDDLDLLVTGVLEDDVELVLLLDDLGSTTGGSATGRSHGDRGGRGDPEGLLELLDELRQLDQRHLLERVEQILRAQLRHDGVPLSFPADAGLG